MASLPEQRLYQTFKRHADSFDHAGLMRLDRVENVMVDGTPDVLVKTPRGFRFVELKYAKLPARPTTRVLGAKGLRPAQEAWILEAARMGLPVYILIHADNGESYLISGKHADYVNSWTHRELLRYSLGVKWADIIHAIWEGEL